MAETFEYPLPSGRVVSMHYPDLWELVFDDTIPDPLTGIIEGLITKTQTAYGMATQSQQKAGDDGYNQITEADYGVQFIQLIVERSVDSPRIATTFEQARQFKAENIEFLHIGQLDQPDIFAIYWKSLGLGDQAAALFRREASEDAALDVVPDQSEDAPAGVEPLEHTPEPALDSVHG